MPIAWIRGDVQPQATPEKSAGNDVSGTTLGTHRKPAKSARSNAALHRRAMSGRLLHSLLLATALVLPASLAHPENVQPNATPSTAPSAAANAASPNAAADTPSDDTASTDPDLVPRSELNGDILGEMHDYYTWNMNEDLLDIARGEELGVIELMVANPGVDPWLPTRNTHLILPTMHILPDAPRKGIVINTAEMRLYYYDAEDGPLSFPLGVGRDGYLTPIGTTKIVRKKENPSWTLTPSEVRDHPELPRVVPPGPDNPLGDFAMYLGWPSYLIHGTNTPWGIGRRTSRGCIRMYPEDIAFLFEKSKIGTKVTVVDQPVKLGWREGELYMEVQPSTMQIDTIEETSKSPGPPDPIPLSQEADRIIAKAGDQSGRLDWPVIEQLLKDRQGYPVKITKPLEQTVAATAENADSAPSPTQSSTPATAATPLPPASPAPTTAPSTTPQGSPPSTPKNAAATPTQTTSPTSPQSGGAPRRLPLTPEDARAQGLPTLLQGAKSVSPQSTSSPH